NASGFIGPNQYLSFGSGVKFGDRQFCFVVEVQQAFSVRQENFPRLGEAHAFAEPVEEFFSELFFQNTYLSTDSRLGPVQLLSRQGETFVNSYFIEISNLIEVHDLV